MKTIADLCKPRQSVFSNDNNDYVLNLSDLIEGRIDAEKFFAENFITRGMNNLFETAFNRFAGKSSSGVIKLTQAMGGGKTHNMLALALLAKNPDLRRNFLEQPYTELGAIKVIAFSGRATDITGGIWGQLAEQLGKKDFFDKDSAPGEQSWVNLLRDQKILILLDELPPYLQYLRANRTEYRDPLQITCTALSNLFVALGKKELANVCLVFSDLKATYEHGSKILQSTFKDLEHEANRTAKSIEPVALNTAEVYDILRKRLFESVPRENDSDVKEIASAFKDSIASAVKSGLTLYRPDEIFNGIRECYPFHPSIKDLYARFKENESFQQTRGLIRLMRQIVRKFYENHSAERSHLINVYDVDLNDPDSLTMIKDINQSLDIAISHDVAQQGASVAELIDAHYNLSFPYAQTLAKLLLISSLSSTLNVVKGLDERDIIATLCAPGLDMNQYKKVLDELLSQCWYIKTDARGRHYFQNIKNMTAEINTLIDSYSNEQAKQDLREELRDNFTPKLKNCYQAIYVMPALDEIKVDREKISLVIYEPCQGFGLNPELKTFYDNQVYKNRIMFLSGQRSMMSRILEDSKKLSAIRAVIKNMKLDHVPESDQQYNEAINFESKARLALLESVRSTFVDLYFPVRNGLTQRDFTLQFLSNKYDGEEQIVNSLIEHKKFSDFSDDENKLDAMRIRCEQRLFTQKEMTWTQILERSATDTSWPWYHPGQMEALKSFCLKNDLWRENFGYLSKGPFPKEPTDVEITQIGDYDKGTGEFRLRVQAINGSEIYYDIGAEATQHSQRLDRNILLTKETEIYFLCVDPTRDNPHPTGPSKRFLCKATLKHEQHNLSTGRFMQLESHPAFEMRYTTDGSNPKESGGLYHDEIHLPDNCRVVRVAVYNHGTLIDYQEIQVTDSDTRINVDRDKQVLYVYKSMTKFTGQKVFDEFAIFKRVPGVLLQHFGFTVEDKNDKQSFMEYNTYEIACTIEKVISMIDFVRNTAFNGKDYTINFDYTALRFKTGADFLQWLDLKKISLDEASRAGTIRQ